MSEDPDASAKRDSAATLDRALGALLDHLPKELILASYQAAGGQEVLSDKFASLESSAALVANAFGFFLNVPELLSLPEPSVAAGSASKVFWKHRCDFRGTVDPIPGSMWRWKRLMF